jgi:hypothetical protein
MTEYLAGWKTSYRDTGKAHACDPDTREEYREGRETYYQARCGQKYLYTNGTMFPQVIKFEQCQRCADILTAEARTEETDGLARAIATLEDWAGSLPTEHKDWPGAIRAIEVLKVYGPRRKS